MRGETWRRMALVLALGSACAAPRAPRPEIVPPRTALDALARQREGTRTLTATFRLNVERDGLQAGSSRGALVVARPDRLRLQLFSLGVMTVYDFTAHGDRFRVRRPFDEEARTGRLDRDADPDAGVAADLRPILLGAAVEPSAVEERGDAYLVRFDEPAGRREVMISRRDGIVLSESVWSDRGDVRLRARYSDHRPVDGLPLPFRIAVEYPARAVSVNIEVERYTRNRPVEDRLFEF